MTRQKAIVSFAIAYQAYCEAAEKNQTGSMRVWSDLLLGKAEELGISDTDMAGLAEIRAQVEAMDRDFIRNRNATLFA